MNKIIDKLNAIQGINGIKYTCKECGNELVDTSIHVDDKDIYKCINCGEIYSINYEKVKIEDKGRPYDN